MAGVCLEEARIATMESVVVPKNSGRARASRVAAVAVADAPVKVSDRFSVPFDRLLENVADTVEISR